LSPQIVLTSKNLKKATKNKALWLQHTQQGVNFPERGNGARQGIRLTRRLDRF
jgi:hypothetical protein